jgi:hypothetical protein
LVAGEQLDHEGAADRGDGQADAQDAGHQAALGRRNLVRQHRHECGEQCIEEQLRHAPPDDDDRKSRGSRDHEHADGTAEQADDHPRPPHAPWS